mgnify:CR=1 FL=1
MPKEKERVKRDRSAIKRTKPGPKSALTPERLDQLCSLLRAGCWISVAARALGVHANTIGQWMKQGKALSKLVEADPELVIKNSDQKLYLQCYKQVIQALAEGEAADVQRVDDAADADWRAAAWKLKIRWKKRWAEEAREKNTVNINQQVGVMNDKGNSQSRTLSILQLAEVLGAEKLIIDGREISVAEAVRESEKVGIILEGSCEQVV